MFRRELFRGSIINRDSRLIPVYVSCQYCIACLFLGMFLILSGIMITTFAEDEEKTFIESEVHYKPNGNSTAKAVGLIILISGCIVISLAIILFFYASLMFLKTTSTPPEENWESLQEHPPEIVVSPDPIDSEGHNGINTSADNQSNKAKTPD